MEWAEDDVKGRQLDQHEVKTARQKEIKHLCDREVYEYATEAEARHERDATQLASSGSIPTKAAPMPTLPFASGVYRGAPQRGPTDLLSNTEI